MLRRQSFMFAHLLIHVFDYQSLHCFRLQTAQHLPKSFGQILSHESRANCLSRLAMQPRSRGGGMKGSYRQFLVMA